MKQVGEARRRRSKPIEIRGPLSYEIAIYDPASILAGSLRALLGDRPSPQAIAIIQAAAQLGERMHDPSLPVMLCMTCDYEFARGEPPAEVMIALPWANPEHPPIVSPICPRCAAAGESDKIAMAKAAWSKLSPGSRFDGPGPA
jgi:hypothetical protein